MIDRNSMRAGAGLSAVLLFAGFVVKPSVNAVIPLVGVALAMGSLFGLRRSPLGAIYRGVKKAFRFSIPVEAEPEAPPRFAQTLGFVFLGVSTVALLVLDKDTVAWTLALMVAALQTLLAATGICVGCEIYTFAKRLTAKAQ